MKQHINNLKSMLLLLIPFWGIMLLELAVRVIAIKNDYVLYSVLFTILMLFLISMSYMIQNSSNKKRKISFNPILMTLWLALCFLMLYSDIIIPKIFCNLSLTFLILFTGLFLVWQQFDTINRAKILDIFLLAIEIGFIVFSLICMMFRPYTHGLRYCGLVTNPNVCGIYIIIIWACLLSRLDYCIEKQVTIIRPALIGIEIGTATTFLYLSAARTAFLTIGFISLVWFIFRTLFTRRSGKKLLKYISTIFGCVIVAFFISHILLLKLPAAINHPITFERDREFTAELSSPKVCYAAEPATDSGIINNLETDINTVITDTENEPSPISRLLDVFNGNISLDSLLNGRLEIYKKYIKALDFFGHKKYSKKVNGTTVVNAHNNVIQFAYSYGIGSAIAYFLLCIFTLIYSIHYYIRFRSRKRTAAFPMLIIIAFLVCTLTECIILPMQSLLAFCFYVCLGELMITYAPGSADASKRK